MKIVLATTMVDAPESQRIREEIESLGHEFLTYDVGEFSVSVVNNELNIPGLTDINPDIVLVRGVLQHLKPFSSLVKRLRKSGIKIFDNNFLVHKYSISKVTDLIKLSTSNIPVPDTYYVKSWDLYAGIAEKLGYPFIIKSVKAGQGNGVFKIDSPEHLKGFIADAQVSDRKAANYIAQRFFPYVYDLRVLVIGEKVFAMRRIPREGDFRANFSLGGTVEKFDLDDRGKQLALDAMRAVDMSIGGVDILIDANDNRVILEVNHTPGMKGMELAVGENIAKVYVEHALREAK